LPPAAFTPSLNAIPTFPEGNPAGAFETLKDIHQSSLEDLLKTFQLDPDRGLTSDQVERSRSIFGPNEFPADDPTPLWVLVLNQFKDALVLILILAALVSLILAFFEEGEETTTAFVEPLVIVLILIANATVGVMQESNAEKAVEALKQYESEDAAVIRDGKLYSVPSKELVPGDLIELAAGNMIPADCRLIRLLSSAIDIDQSILTGESQTVSKDAKAVPLSDAAIQDKTNILFSGTLVTRGGCRAVIVGTGLYTEKGKIQKELAKKTEEVVPLREKLDEFGALLSKVIGVICVAVWAVNFSHFDDPAFEGNWIRGAVYYFKISVSLAVAAIPEGLPAVVTTCLALGTQRMAAKNAIVRSLPAVETLGCTSVICSDKTGTLTTNQMSVQRFFILDQQGDVCEFSVEGNSYAPLKAENGKPYTITSLGKMSGLVERQSVDLPAMIPSIQELAKVSALCNDAKIVINNTGLYGIVGQPTEGSLKVLAEKIGVPDLKLNSERSEFSVLTDPNFSNLTEEEANLAASLAAANFCDTYWNRIFKKQYTLEFNRDRKSMSVLVENAMGSQLLVKGAWDSVLPRCTKIFANGKEMPMTEGIRRGITAKIENYCSPQNCFRCLVLAKVDPFPYSLKEVEAANPPQFINFEHNMTFIGVVGILDPPREEVKFAIEKCQKAGIRVIVITGDNKNTAASICRKIGLFKDQESIEGKAFTGMEFRNFTLEEKLECIKHAKLFARVEPSDKQLLVQLLHQQDHVVAMTGDGVNDATALKEADIGLAMGSGTAVAKGAAKMILRDDNFTTIVAAVEEGRNIYNNTKQFIRYLICSNIGEVVAIFLTAVSGLPEVLLPVQLLWVNLVTDGLPAIALGFNPPEGDIMSQSPRPRKEAIVNASTFFRYMIVGTYIGLATVSGMIWWFCFNPNGPMLDFDQLFGWATCTGDCSVYHLKNPGTMSLSVLVTIEMFCALNSISERSSLFSHRNHPFSNFYLLAAMSLSFGLHFLILYVPFLARIFSVVPLSFSEWKMVFFLSFPVVLVDEVVKYFIRATTSLQKTKLD